ncbi:hypothetical protein AD998_12480 [bacterium 336/3]|nr:hypothetical protein AD998_12480 [bacterium 336/3]
MRRFYYILLITFIGFLLESKAQNALFSQYYYPTPLFSNPAWVAARQEVFVGFNFRRQQISVGQGISTSALEVSLPIIDQNNRRAGGFGLGVLNETAGKGGLLRTNAFIGNLAYNVDFSDYDHLAFGMQGGYFFRRLDPNLLTSESQYTVNGYNAGLPLNEPFVAFKSDFPVVNAGLLWYGEDDNQKLLYHFGVSGYTLNRPNTTWFAEISRIPWLINASGEFLIYEKDSWSIYPTVRYIEQSKKRNLQIGSHFRYQIDGKSLLYLGSWYNTNKKVIVSLDFAKENYHFAFSYDFALGNRNVLGQTNSAFELSMIWKKPVEGRKKRPNKRPIIYPDKKKPVITKDTAKKEENITRVDTTLKFKKELGDANRVEKSGGMKIIIQEPLEVSVKKKKQALKDADKRLLVPIWIRQDDVIIDQEKLYQIAQLMLNDTSLKIKMVLFTEPNNENQILLESQTDEIRKQLILQGIEPERILRQNIKKKGEKNRVEWVVLRK